MMVIPRQYAQALPKRSRSTDFNEKGRRSTRSPSKSQSPVSPSSFLRLRDSSTKSENRTVQTSRGKENEKIQERPPPIPLIVAPKKRESAKEVLSATAIPIRRKPRGRPSQRLPKVDHVAHFSSLLMDDVKSRSPRSVSDPNFEGLFGNMDELLEDGQMYVGSEGYDSGILSTRSMSDDSLVSLQSPDDYPHSDQHSQHSFGSPSHSERRPRRITPSDCSNNHPLSPPRSVGSSLPSIPDLSPLPGKDEHKSRQSLVSSLTASLKALKSAAQSISTRSTTDSANAKAKSFFEFHPQLTDDRRPPANFRPPTADLRRYLNPPPLDSAAQLHFWQDQRQAEIETKQRKRSPNRRKPSPQRRQFDTPVRDLPSVVQLSDCLPSAIRTSNASSPPIWLASDGTPVNKSTAVPLLFDPDANNGKGEPVLFRHREPRENPDFLRVFVCEMEMRRAGKLSEDMGAGRARLWLPAVTAEKEKKEDGVKVEEPKKKRAADVRMACLSIEDV